MSNFPENEKLNTEETVSPENQNDELSTIFSAPTEHKKKAVDGKKRKRFIAALASVLAVAVLVGGTVTVIKLIPERADEEIQNPSLEDIEVLNLNTDELKSVTVTNSNGRFKIYSAAEEGDDTSSSSDTVNWYLDGYDKELVSTGLVLSVASNAALITASREITQKTASECGFDQPAITAEIEKGDGSTVTVLVGADSPDNMGCYVKLADSDKIYLSDSSVKSNLEFDAISLANTDSMPGIALDDSVSEYKDENGDLATFDSITVTGKNFPDPIVIALNENELFSNLIPYIITSPVKRMADKVDPVLTIFKSGVSVEGAYSYDTSAASLKKFGLDSPDFAATIKVGSKTHTYKFKLQSDGGYAAVCDGVRLIKKVSASNLSFIEYEPKDFYWVLVSMVSIDDISSFIFKTPEKTYEFGIEAVEDEEAEEKYIITYNGQKLDTDNFQSFYQLCVGLTSADYTIDTVSSEPEYSFIYILKDGENARTTIDFVRVSETRLQYSIDGIEMGKVLSSDLKKLARAAEKVIVNEPVN